MTAQWISPDPKFVTPFQILYEFERVQIYKVEVYDADEDKPPTELILSAQVNPTFT